MFPLGAMAEVSPKLVNSYNMSRALELYNNNEFNEAFTYFQKELDDNKENYYAHTMVAKHYMWKREYGLALKSLNLAVKYADKKDETLVEILRIRSDLYGYMNDETKAKADLDQAVKLFPKSATPYVNRSDYYVSKDQFEMAEKDMVKAMSIDETDRDVRMEYAIVLRNLDKYDEAIANLDYLIKMYPRNEYAYFQRSLCESLKGDYSSAVDDVIMVDKLGGDKSSMYMELADDAVV